MTTQSWLKATYKSTNFFTLKPANATSSGGKSLLCPTPFAIKMALLDAALRTLGEEQGAALFPTLRDLQIAIRLPSEAVVNNTSIKIMRPHHSDKLKDTTGPGLPPPMGNAIAFREYVSFRGCLDLAFSGLDPETLIHLLIQINYLGKRGSFMQLDQVPQMEHYTHEALLDQKYTLLTEPAQSYEVNGLLQMLDDCSPKMTFAHANIYDQKRIGKERVIHQVVLPYRLVRSSKSYSYYERF